MIGFDLKMCDEFIDRLCSDYPFLKCGSVGKSLCGRELRALQLGPSKNSVLFAAAFHGMEWLTSLLVLVFTKRISEAFFNNSTLYGIDVKSALSRRGLVVVPCVNPDGVEISLNGAQTAGSYASLVDEILRGGDASRWQANARGVDLNHNFNANWAALHKLEEERGITAPAPTRYGGPFPESEPETKAIVNLCEDVSFRHAVAFHSQGEEIYWHFGKNTPPHAETMGQTMANLSGYKLAEPEGLAVGGGFKDWFIERFSRPGFTVEIGKGINPLPLSDIEPIYKRLEKMLVYCCFA